MNPTHRRAFIASIASYEDEEAASAILELHDMKLALSLSVGSVQCTVAIHSKSNERFIAFRGTEPKEVKDWLVNLRADLISIRGIGNVHSGFYGAADQLFIPLVEYLNGNPSFDSGLATIVTGHSQGGALASCFMIMLASNGYNDQVDGSVTFGSPRTFGKDAAKWYDRFWGDTTARYVNNNDIVTRVPFGKSIISKVLEKIIPFYWLLPVGYKHVGKMFYVKANGCPPTIVVNPDRWTLFKDRIRGRWLDLGHAGTDGFNDHSMNTYYDAMCVGE